MQNAAQLRHLFSDIGFFFLLGSAQVLLSRECPARNREARESWVAVAALTGTELLVPSTEALTARSPNCYRGERVGRVGDGQRVAIQAELAAEFGKLKQVRDTGRYRRIRTGEGGRHLLVGTLDPSNSDADPVTVSV